MIPNYHRDFFRRPLKIFDPFPHNFWDNFPYDFPSFRAPPLMMIPPRHLFPDMGRMVPPTKTEHIVTPEALYFKVELPAGIRKEDVRVKIEENGKMLHVSAKKKYDKEVRKDRYHHIENSYGEFMTRFVLPSDVKPEHLRIHVDNGVLTITIPRQQLHYHHHHQHNY